MDQNYLLTYQHIKNICGCTETTFAWFNTEEEMNEFIETHDIKIMEKIKIINAEDLTD